MTDHSYREFFDSYAPRSLWLRERGWVPTELSLLCRTAGFTVVHVWGGTAGEWGRRPVRRDE